MSNSIKALILDVDGVILGEKEGYNFPQPHADVIAALKSINKQRPIILCTAKPLFSVENIIQRSQLYSTPHICEAGALIVDGKSGKVISQDVIENSLVVKVIKNYQSQGFYTEFYTRDNYYAQSSQKAEITKLHAHSLLKDPVLVDDLAEEAKQHDIIKIITITKDESEKPDVEDIFQDYSAKLNLYWGIHPIALPAQFAVITTDNVSKKLSSVKVIKDLGIPFQNVLGVGDGMSDWQFMEECGYAAAMGNAKDKLKDLVIEKGDKYGFVAPTVDENGILSIFKHYKLIND